MKGTAPWAAATTAASSSSSPARPGLDDWEWGVTLFGVHPDDLKACVYEMRFDEASARYAEFGPFFTGMVDRGRGRPRQRRPPVGVGRWRASRRAGRADTPVDTEHDAAPARRGGRAAARPALERLRAGLGAGRVVVAFSGGADSALLAHVATDTLGPDARAVRHGRVRVAGPRGARGLPCPGRRVGTALAPGPHRGDRRSGLPVANDARPLLPLQDEPPRRPHSRWPPPRGPPSSSG